MLLTVRGVSKSFGGVAALRGVSFDLGRGEVLGVVGANGSGKSTLLNIIARAFDPDAGEVEFGSINLLSMSASRAARKGVARIWQILHTLEGLTAFDHAALGLWQQRRRFFLRPDEASAIRSILSDLGLADKATALVDSLAYFDRRKVDFARCLAAKPMLLLADELTSGLTGDEMSFFVKHIHALKRAGVSMLVVEHNWSFIKQIADKVLVMNSGDVEYLGTMLGYFGE